MSNTFLEIKTLDEIDQHSFEWPTSDIEYYDLGKKITEYLSISCPDFFKEKFSVIENQIAKGLFEFISITLDLKKIKNKIFNLRNIREEVYLSDILRKKQVMYSYNYELELSRRPKNFFKNSLIKWYFRYSDIKNKNLIISKNNLYQHFCKRKDKINFYIPPVYFLSLKKKQVTQEISSVISKNFINFLQGNIFDPNDLEKKSIFNLINSYILRIEDDFLEIKYNFSKIQNCKTIVTGTGDQYFNRLMSYYAKKNGIYSIRFDHGGERFFFKDDYNLSNELSFVDKYYSFGKLGSEYLKKLTKSFNNLNDIVFEGVSYEHINKKSLKKSHHKSENKNDKILFIGQSYVGQSRNPLGYKLFDPILYNWHFFLLSNLKAKKIKVVYKAHPKGVGIVTRKLEKLAHEVSTNKMSEVLENFDIILTDYVGTAFLEAMACGKKIILLDTLKRIFNPEISSSLFDNISIIKCYWDRNLLRVDIPKLIQCINEQKNSNDSSSMDYYNSIYR